MKQNRNRRFQYTHTRAASKNPSPISQIGSPFLHFYMQMIIELSLTYFLGALRSCIICAMHVKKADGSENKESIVLEPRVNALQGIP